MRVELRYATLPFPVGAFAVHHWFVVFDGNARTRWEVWQTKNAGPHCIGHVHRDLKGPDDGVGGGPACIAARWDGEPAKRIARVLQSVENYPYCERYRYWPGPNSNTFAAWVLREAGVEQPLHWKAFGKNYKGKITR
jgi:hypothetical protein